MACENRAKGPKPSRGGAGSKRGDEPVTAVELLARVLVARRGDLTYRCGNRAGGDPEQGGDPTYHWIPSRIFFFFLFIHYSCE